MLPIYVGFTSYGKRLLLAHKGISSLMKPNQSEEPELFIITVYKDDLKYFVANETLMKWKEEGRLRLVIAPTNLKNNLKYYYAMQAYSDKPFITVDEDASYSSNFLESLYKAYTEHPEYVCSIRNVRAHFEKPIMQWIWYKQDSDRGENPSFETISEGIGGVIYPPNFCRYIIEWYPHIMKNTALQKNDDLVLHWIKYKNGIKTYRVKQTSHNDLQYIKYIENAERPSWLDNYKGKGVAQEAVDILQSIIKIE